MKTFRKYKKIELTSLIQICSLQIHAYTNVCVAYTSIYKSIAYITATQLIDFFSMHSKMQYLKYYK